MVGQDKNPELAATFALKAATFRDHVIARAATRSTDLLCNLATGADQVGDEPVVHVEDAFVLGPIPHIVTLRQDSPDLRSQAKGVGQHLKYDVSLG